MPLFVISFVNFLKMFVKPLITSCQICHFLSSHLNIWPNPWWIFGILAIFAKICLYRLNFPFSYNRYLYKMPVFLFSFKFCKPLIFWWIFQKIRWFRKKWHFRKNPQLTTSFFCHLVLIFAKPLINSCQIGHFCQSCYSR